VAHTPPEQTSPAPQRWPHAPQWFPSVASAAHTVAPPSAPLAQACCPVGHATRHSPAWQRSLPTQRLLQRPQLLSSLAEVTQRPSHAVCPAPQVSG
jgi:hypothetical protein